MFADILLIAPFLAYNIYKTFPVSTSQKTHLFPNTEIELTIAALENCRYCICSTSSMGHINALCGQNGR
jgi:hypothetical protein